MSYKTAPTRVMIVDDDPTAISLIEQHLAGSGYTIRTAVDGNDSLRLMRLWKPNIVILDWVMPGMDGPAVCREIRAAADGGYTHVIMLTMHESKQKLVEAFDAGVDDFLSKPVDAGELLARLHAAKRMIDLRLELSRRERKAARLGARMARMNEELRHLAMTDDLTGLINRREAHRRLSHSWALAERYGHPLSCALVDIDDFKLLNDTHGHVAGDGVLKIVATALQNQLRATDGVCRYGGDEFLLFFPQQNMSQAIATAERIRTAVGEARKPVADWPVTLSIGLARREEGMLTFHDLIDHADQALYHAKRTGKNQISMEKEKLVVLSV